LEEGGSSRNRQTYPPPPNPAHNDGCSQDGPTHHPGESPAKPHIARWLQTAQNPRKIGKRLPEIPSKFNDLQPVTTSNQQQDQGITGSTAPKTLPKIAAKP
ncbi:hypothetical protein, partial [Devosia riboflavina]|uniref:hypothetical protein n=1 Tax=Devosia riboflavina TaxID=46914 RepID=UPI001AEBF21D